MVPAAYAPIWCRDRQERSPLTSVAAAPIRVPGVAPGRGVQADGRGLRVVTITGAHPRWMAWPGRWGHTRARPLPFESDSPLGPSHQPRWKHFIGASACHAAAEPANVREWVMLAAVALVAAGGVLARRRRRAATS